MHIPGAVKKWTTTRSARSNIVRHLLERSGIKPSSDPSHELRNSEVKRFHSDIEKIDKTLDTTLMPFTDQLMGDQNLYCLSDGKIMPDDRKDNKC